MKKRLQRRSSRSAGSIFIISAPSGAGKSTLIHLLMNSVDGLRFSVSHTTRPPRQGEEDGREYFFVSPARFQRMITGKRFLEWAKVHTFYYGTSWKQLRTAQNAGYDVILDVDVQGHAQVRKRLPEAVSIFVLPPSYSVLERRLRGRHADAPKVIEKRLQAARQEILHWPEYDYLVINDLARKAFRTLQAIVTAARSRSSVQQQQAREICKTFGG